MKLIWLALGIGILNVQQAFAQFGCGSAVAITDGYTTGTVTTPGTAGAENWVSSVTTCGESSSYYTSSDVYLYAYTTGASVGEAFSLTINANNQWMSIGVFSTCSGGTLGGCLTEQTFTSTTGPIGVCATGLSANTTYYIAISRWASPTDLSFEVTEFDVTSSSTRPDDECATATAIDITQGYKGSTRCDYTPSASSPATCGSIQNDSWFRFTAASADSVVIDYDITFCSNNDGVQLSVLTGACGSLTQVTGSCINPALGTGTWKFTGLTVGNTYYIRVDGYAGDLCTYQFDPVSGVAVLPPNDSCITAASVSCGTSDTNGIVLATAGDAPAGTCGGLTAGKGVWYTFAGNGDSLTISTDDVYTNFDTEIMVFSGTCGAYTCVGSDNDGGSSGKSVFKFLTSNGTNYYVYIDGNGASEGEFVVNFSCTTPSGGGGGGGCDANAGSWN